MKSGVKRLPWKIRIFAWIEIEGSKDNIKYFADQLGLNWEERILKNYLEIFDILKNHLHLQFKDLTFDNFKAVDIDAAQFRQHLAAG
jgi:adenylate cyclase class 2